MGVLLTFMFLVNMLAAIIILPALARWLYWDKTKTGGHTLPEVTGAH